MKKNLTRILSLLLVLVLMVGVLPVSALADGWDLTGELDTEQLFERAEPVEMQASASDFSKILHLDCGRKYFTKDWIIALLYEMQAAGYNQLQLAFGNDGLRFLLNDMSFTANGKSYSHDTVVSKVEAGNRAQNSSNDSSWLTEAEMDAIIAKATELGIEIVPLLNLPGHANALLDIADDTYNATGSNNTLNVVSADDSARNFGMAIFKKYVDYFHSKGCNYFNFGADEYANDASGLFSFSRLTEQEYARFASFINSLAAYIVSNGMTPRAFNDGLYYNKSNPWDMNTSKNTSIKSIQCCYWSSGWDAYPVATASQIAQKTHSMINTHGDFYYVLGKSDKFDSGYSYASGFYNTTFAGGTTITNPVGSMFCIWCDYPNAETETVVAQKTRLVLRAMAARMDNKSIDTISKAVVANGFNEDGTLNNAGTEFKIVDCEGGTTPTLEVGKALTLCIANGASAEWSASPADIVQIEVSDSANANRSVSGSSVKVTALKAGEVTITATNPDEPTQTANFTLTVQPRKATDITVYVGQDHTITVNGSVQVETHPNAHIATVTTAAGTSSVPVFEKITSTADLESGKSYLIESAQAANNGNNATLLTNKSSGNKLSLSGKPSTTSPDSAKWTITKTGSKYYIQSSTQYLTIGNGTAGLSNTSVALGLSTMENSGMMYWDISRTPVRTTYHLNQYGGVDATVAGGYTSDASNDAGSCWNIYKITEGTTPSTTITFHGVALGNTTATIGGVDYNIHVVSKTLANVDPLEIEFWITNQMIFNVKTGQTADNHKAIISAADPNVNSEAGIAVDDKSPDVGYNHSGEARHYWMTVRLDSEHKQTASDGVDQTAVGTTLTHVRYLNDAWQYKTLAGKWKPFQSGDQLVAYYLQKTDVTKDVETYVKDWGFGTDLTTPKYSSHVALTIAVVYPDGTVQPVESDMYSQATTIFNYWENRDIGIVSPKVNENYRISKMTVTNGNRTNNTGVNEWYPTDTITWDKVTTESGGKWYNETVVWQKSDGTTPMVNGAAENIRWTASDTAKLVLIYLEPVQKDTNLNLVYHNDTDNETILLSQIAMAYNAGADEPTYDNSLRYGSAPLTIPADRKWSDTDSSGTNYLPDNAYVVNAAGINQTFNKDVARIPDVAPKYQSGFYKYYGADVSADGKTLTLHYVIDNAKLTKQYVLDFGLPLRIPLSDLIENEDLSTVVAVYANGEQLSSTSDYSTQHGTLGYDADMHEIIYTRTSTFSDNTISTANFKLKYQDGTFSTSIAIGVIPASNILYEENFLTPGVAAGNEIAWTAGESSAPTTPQERQKVVSASEKPDFNVFGFDRAYEDKAVETGVWKASGLEQSNITTPLTTSFYGNGFDLIGNCGPNTGRVLMIISPADKSHGDRIVYVDTRYNAATLHQVPLAHVEFPSDSQYHVEIYASGLDPTTVTPTSRSSIATASLADAYSAAEDELLLSLVRRHGLTLADVEYVSMDNVIPASDAADVSLYGMPSAAALTADAQTSITHEAGTHVEIDSFRVYRSTNKYDAIAEKYPVAEKDIVYNNIIDVVKGEIVAFTEGNPAKKIDITEYEAAGGPQNEIYIGQRQAISFRVEGATEIQVSLRAVTNTAAQWATSADGEDVSTISTNTEMYYTITKDSSGNFVIANRGDALLAIGNVKLPSGAKTMSASEIDEDALRASLCAALGLSAEQPQAFQPKTFTARATTLPMLRNKRVSVLITISNDVSYVTVNGVKYTPSRYYASWQKTRLIQFGETLGRYESKTYTIIAYDANGVASAPITVNG